MTVTDAPPLALNIWGHEPNPNVIQTIHRFGIEYEMFPRGYRGAVGGDDWCCEECDGARPTPGYHGGVPEYIARASALGLAHDRAHEYHCRCDECSYTRSRPLMATQNDATVAVEMVSRILDVRSETDMDSVAEWIAFVESWKADGHWMPDGVTTCGNHIHVGRDDANSYPYLTGAGFNLIQAAYAAYDWTLVADGGCGRIRGYNTKPSHGIYGFSGSWLSSREHTVEHRLWNTPSDPERLWAHLGLSVALTRWGAHMERMDHTRPGGWWVGEYAAHIDDFKRAVIAYLPVGPRFEQAAQLLNDHLVNY